MTRHLYLVTDKPRSLAARILDYVFTGEVTEGRDLGRTNVTVDVRQVTLTAEQVGMLEFAAGKLGEQGFRMTSAAIDRIVKQWNSNGAAA